MRRLFGSLYDMPLVKLIIEIVFVILPIAFIIRTVIFGLYMVPTPSMETTLLMGERFLGDKLTYWFRMPKRGEIIAFNEPLYKYSSNIIVNLWQRYVSWHVSNWTKRVIAIPGDNIKGTIEQNKPALYLNGKKLDESSYVNNYPIIFVWKYPEYLRQKYNGIYSSINDKDLKSFDPKLPWNNQPFYNINPEQIILNSLGQPIIFWPGTPTNKDIFEWQLKENQFIVLGDNRLGSDDSREWGILDGKLIHGRIIYRIWSMDSNESWWFIDLIKNPVNFWKKIRWSRCFNWVK